MILSKRKALPVLILLTGFITFSCVNNQSDDETQDLKKERKTLIENIANNLALPHIEDLHTKVNTLHNETGDFTADPDQQNLEAVQTSFRTAYIAWQKAAVFAWDQNADALNIRRNVNSFPVDTQRIRNNIQSGTYDLGSASQVLAKGFPALDYLLFDVNDNNNQVLNRYTSDSASSNYIAYLEDVTGLLQQNIDEFFKHWSPDHDNFVNTFQNRIGTDQGSGLGLLVNGITFDLEIIKNEKLGEPIGIFAGDNTNELHPEDVEGYYSGYSKTLLAADFQQTKNIYFGTSPNGQDDKGLHDYLQDIDARFNGGALADTIEAQVNNTEDAIANLPDQRLSTTIENNKEIVMQARNEGQKLVTLFKSDMASAMGILINYADNDGD